MDNSEPDLEERKIEIESKSTILFLSFVLIEAYLIISSSAGFYPYTLIEDYPDYFIVLDSPAGLYALYWIGIFCLILGFLVGEYNKIYPPIVLIGSIIIFLLFII